jgi:hypothetical protein
LSHFSDISITREQVVFDEMVMSALYKTSKVR